MSTDIIGGADGPTSIILMSTGPVEWIVRLVVLAAIVTSIVFLVKRRRKK